MLLPEHRVLDWTLEVLDGPEFRLSAYRGKAVFVNIFASWCPPCRREQPTVVEFARAHADDGDTVVIGLDAHEEDDTVRAYRKKFAISYPIAMDRKRQLFGLFPDHDIKLPTTIVFRADGMLSCAWLDEITRDQLEDERLAALAPLPS
ncbi:MAG: TlpA family protein disulfide reductase [Candidatus Eremiobacteraeota bacterium]|nr:TlpA family protein disulfide reductase [Candidatus Eremiobacteraeota bacterium]